MSTANDSPREHPSTYIVQDRSNQEEMTRLSLQDQMLTASLGGPLSEQTDPASFERVLDVGCGTGGWLIELAQTCPSIKQLVGIDISATMLAYARAQAQAAGVSDRVSFELMDASRMLELPAASFDLVNQRLGTSFLRTWEWVKLLSEYQRVCTPGGVIRITEADPFWQSPSPALTRLSDLWRGAFHQSGHSFPAERNGVTSALARLLTEQGLLEVQTRYYQLTYRAGTPEGEQFCENVRLSLRVALPFLRKWTRVPEDYEEIYQQMLREMQHPDFEASWSLLTAWGINPAY